MIYTLTPESSNFVDSITELAQSVAFFNERFGLKASTINMMDVEPADKKEIIEMLLVTLPMIVEETGEFAKALNGGYITEAAKELIDIIFVSLQRLQLLGEIGDAALDFTRAKNDVKSNENTHIGMGSKIIKNQDYGRFGKDGVDGVIEADGNITIFGKDVR